MTLYKSFSRSLIVTLLISFLAINCFSQHKPNYTLLWKISGNGLSKPSYLFGTMHVKDRRVFNFSDSVMLSIQSCSRFALEVHPDTILNIMFAALQKNDTLRNIDKLLSKDQYNKLAKKFEEKNGYPIGKTDPMLVESLMEPDENKADDKITFIDAYLYGIARTLNKSIYGLEDASSQFDQYFGSKDLIKNRLLELLEDDNEANIDERKEEMIKIYSTGDLDAIYKYAEESGSLDSVIMARNKVMASSMIKYMAGETLFAAVGAAHLPGPGGVIALLRKAGYTVNPVQAIFTGVADKFHIDYLKMNWPTYRNEKMGYAVDFPGTPIKTVQKGLTTIVYPDMANNVYYGMYALPRGTVDAPANRADVISQTLRNYKNNKGYQVISKKEIIYKNLPCTEVLIKGKSTYMRMRLILTNNLLYCLYTGSSTSHLYVPNIDRYLNSFTSFRIAEKPAQPWIAYTNTTGAFTVKFPEQPEEVIKEQPAQIHAKSHPFVMNIYVGPDTLNAKTYLVRYNDYPPGVYLKDKAALFNGLKKDFENRGTLLGEPVVIWNDGYEGREAKLILKGGYYSSIRVFIRGNRVYMLLKEVTQPNLKDNMKDPFFESFHLLPYIEPKYYTYQPDSAGFKIQIVSKPTILSDSSKDYTNFVTNVSTCYSTNPASGGVYGFEYSKISPYYRIANTDSLYKNLTDKIVDYQDSLLKVDTVLINGKKAREILLMKKITGEKSRVRVLIDNDNVFYFSGHLDNSELFDNASNVFYNSLVITRPRPPVDLSASKAEKICHDLGSADTLVYKRALGALSYYKFTPVELPYVYAALQKSYPDDTTSDGARYTLIKNLKTVSDDSAKSVLIHLYSKLNGKDELKAIVLSAMPYVDKTTGYNTYMTLLTQGEPLKTNELYEAFRPLNDSIGFTAKNFGQLLPFIKYSSYRAQILKLAKNMVNTDNHIYDKIIKDNWAAITANGEADMDSFIALKDSTKNEWYGPMTAYFQLINKIKGQDFNEKFTARYLKKDLKGIYAPEAVIARIYNDLPLNPVLVNKLLDSTGTRYDIMEAYSTKGKLSSIPLKYRTSQAFASLCLYQDISADDDGTPQKITLLGSLVKNGAIYYVFKFFLPDREDDAALIGITGPYMPGSAKLNFKKYYAYTNYDKLKINWREQALKMIEPLNAAYK